MLLRGIALINHMVLFAQYPGQTEHGQRRTTQTVQQDYAVTLLLAHLLRNLVGLSGLFIGTSAGLNLVTSGGGGQ